MLERERERERERENEAKQRSLSLSMGFMLFAVLLYTFFFIRFFVLFVSSCSSCLLFSFLRSEEHTSELQSLV